jgi:O-antigen/teichoic acid export membrane protein
MPRYFIERYAGSQDLGIFAAMWALITAGNMVAIALGQSLFPRMSRFYLDRDLEGFKRLLIRSVQVGAALAVLASVGAVIAGKTLLTLIYRPEYAERHWLFAAMMLMGIFPYTITGLGYAATAAKAFKAQAKLMCIVSLVTLTACAVFIPHFRLWGAVLAVSIGGSAHVCGLLWILRGLTHGGLKAKSLAGCSMEVA